MKRSKIRNLRLGNITLFLFIIACSFAVYSYYNTPFKASISTNENVSPLVMSIQSDLEKNLSEWSYVDLREIEKNCIQIQYKPGHFSEIGYFRFQGIYEGFITNLEETNILKEYYDLVVDKYRKNVIDERKAKRELFSNEQPFN